MISENQLFRVTLGGLALEPGRCSTRTEFLCRSTFYAPLTTHFNTIWQGKEDTKIMLESSFPPVFLSVMNAKYTHAHVHTQTSFDEHSPQYSKMN